jgi:hypothetical protein
MPARLINQTEDFIWQFKKKTPTVVWFGRGQQEVV